MALTYGFYDSLNHDRLYNAQQMSAIFDGIINDGVFMSVGNQLHTVAGSGMQVIVKSGRAWFNSTWTLNDQEYPLTISAADVLLTRIDAVVLEVNSEQATRANSLKIVKGTPASTPVKPTLTNTSTVHQHALAYVTVAKNTQAITNSMIEIVVGKTETPYVTAILQTTDITDLFNQWQDQFTVWFETVKGTLDGDVALNLQNQIDHCVKKADKATSADIAAGTADKWVDANIIKQEIDSRYKVGDIRLVTKDDNIDNTYLLCNGSGIIPEENSEYYSTGLHLESCQGAVKIYDINSLPPIYKITSSTDDTLTSQLVDKSSECQSLYIDQYDNNIYALCKYTVGLAGSSNYEAVGVVYKLNSNKTAFTVLYSITTYKGDYLILNGFCVLLYGNSGNSLIAIDLRNSSEGNIKTAYMSASAYEDGNSGIDLAHVDAFSNDRIFFYRNVSAGIFSYFIVRKQSNVYFYRDSGFQPTYSAFALGSFDNSGNFIMIFGAQDSYKYYGYRFSGTDLVKGTFTKTSISGQISTGTSSSDYFYYKGIPTRLTRFPNGVAMCGRSHITNIQGTIPISTLKYPSNYTYILPFNNKYYLVCIPDNVRNDTNQLKMSIYEVENLTNSSIAERKLIWCSSVLENYSDYPIDLNDYKYKDMYVKMYTDLILGYVTPTNTNSQIYMYLKVKK